MGSKFACGWCEGTCEVMQECSNIFVDTEGENSPAPVIDSFTPMSGKTTVSKIIMFTLVKVEYAIVIINTSGMHDNEYLVQVP